MGTTEYGVLAVILLLLLGGTKLSGIITKGKNKPSTSSSPITEINTKAEFQRLNIKSVKSPSNPEPPKA